MKTIIKNGLKKTTRDKEKPTYIKTCKECKCVFTYQSSDIDFSCILEEDYVVCPYCHNGNVLWFGIKRKYRPKNKNVKN